MAIGSRRAEAHLTANPAGLKPGLRKAEREFQSFGRRIAKGLGGAMKRAGSFVGSSLNPLGRGLDLIGDAVGEVMEYERGVTRLAQAQGKSNEEMAGFHAEINRISAATGVSRNELLASAKVWQDLTSDTEGAAIAMETFARVSKGTGTSLDDIAAAASAARNNLRVSNAEMEAMFGIWSSQGDAGAVGLEDFASELAELSSTYQQFAGASGLEGARELGAAFQVARRGAGSSNKAATNLNALMNQLIGKAKKLSKEGVHVFGKDGKLRDFGDILGEIVASPLWKDPTKLKDVFGSDEALKALRSIGGELASFEDLAKNNDMTAIQRKYDQYQESSAGQLEAAMNKLKLAIAEAFSPELIKAFAEGVSEIIAMVNEAIDRIDRFRKKAEDFINTLRGHREKLPGEEDVERSRKRQGEIAERTGLGGNDAFGKMLEEDRVIGLLSRYAAGTEALPADGSGADILRLLRGTLVSEEARRIGHGLLTQIATLDAPAAAQRAAVVQRSVASTAAAQSQSQATADKYLPLIATNDAYARGTARSTLDTYAKDASPDVAARYFAAALARVMREQPMQVNVHVDGENFSSVSRKVSR